MKLNNRIEKSVEGYGLRDMLQLMLQKKSFLLVGQNDF